jgi:hypothetical protein
MIQIHESWTDSVRDIGSGVSHSVWRPRVNPTAPQPHSHPQLPPHHHTPSPNNHHCSSNYKNNWKKHPTLKAWVQFECYEFKIQCSWKNASHQVKSQYRGTAANVQDDHNAVHVKIKCNTQRKKKKRKKKRKNVIPLWEQSKLKLEQEQSELKQQCAAITHDNISYM